MNDFPVIGIATAVQLYTCYYHFIHTSSLFFQNPHSFFQKKHETGKTAWKGKKTGNASYAIEKSRTKHTIFHSVFYFP